MSNRASTLVRLGFAGAAVAAGVALAAPAHAADNLPYNCQYELGEATGSFATTANLTSNTDGRILPVGQGWHHRLSGTVTLPAEFIKVLRDSGSHGMDIRTIKVNTTISGIAGDYLVWIYPYDVAFPKDIPIDLTGDSKGRSIVPEKPGTYVVTVGALEFDTEFPDSLSLTCSPAGGADMTIGTFTVPGAATPSPTPSATSSAERPKVVQTDFADEGPSSALSLPAAGALLALGGGTALLMRSRPHTGARHH